MLDSQNRVRFASTERSLAQKMSLSCRLPSTKGKLTLFSHTHFFSELLLVIEEVSSKHTQFTSVLTD